jgi:aryl-alcohol dehydrogenase-like predicted oxidoreductase
MHKTFAPGDHRVERWTPDDLRRRVHQATALRAAIGGTVYTMRGAALRYALCNGDVSSVLLGPRNVVQIDQLVREAGKGPPYLTDEKLLKLANRFEDLGVKT